MLLFANESYGLSRQAKLVVSNDTVDVFNVETGFNLTTTRSFHIRVLLAAASPIPTELTEPEAEHGSVIRSLIRYYEREGLLESNTPPAPAVGRVWSEVDLIFHAVAITSDMNINADPTDVRTVELPLRVAAKSTIKLDDALLLRRSAYGETQPRLQQLTDLLGNSLGPTLLGVGHEGMLERRRYPSGGSLHALSACLALRETSEYAAGYYEYDSRCHRLVKKGGSATQVASYLQSIARHTPFPSQLPGACLMITAEYQRVAKKYGGLTYRLLLIECGALLQTLSLVAEAFDLNTVAIGRSPTGAFESLSHKHMHEKVCLLNVLLSDRVPR